MIPEGQNIYQLLRAEVWLAALLEGGTAQFDAVTLQRNGSFRQSFRNDMESVTAPVSAGDAWQVTLSRDSLYDRLPEGLFHQPRKAAQESALSHMVSEYRRYRDEERQARRFFQPLEQELLRFSTMVEQTERDALFGQLHGDLPEAIIQFWNFPKEVPAQAAARMARLMPWAWRIKGDVKLTAQALSAVLDLEVNGSETVSHHQSSKAESLQLGAIALGADSVSGSRFTEPALEWILCIKGAGSEALEAFVSEGPLHHLLRHFEERFCPLHVNISFELECIEKTQEEAPAAILGFSMSV